MTSHKQFITSPQNPLIKTIKRLATPKGRDTEQAYIVEGLRSCTFLIEQKQIPFYIICSQSAEELCDQTFGDIKTEIVVVPDSLMQTLSCMTTAPGIMGIFETNRPTVPEKFSNSALVLCQINDPGNMGTLMRTASALGLNQVILIEGCEPYNPKVVQASAGTIGTLDIFQMNWQEFRAKTDRNTRIALTLNGNIQKPTINTPFFVIVGNEAHGIPHEWINECAHQFTLEMPGNAESLNAAVAGSIALYVLYQ